MRCESWGGDTLETLIGSRETIIGYAAGLVGRDEAEDVAQDVAVRALEASSKRGFSSEAHFQNWLFSVARNRCVSVLRKRVNLGFPINEGTADPEPGPERQYLSKEGFEELAIKLAGLNRDQRVIFHLRYVMDLEYTDIARILGISAGSARQGNFNTLNILRKLPQDEY